MDPQTAPAAVSGASQAASGAAEAVSAASAYVEPTGFSLVLDRVYWFLTVHFFYVAVAAFAVLMVAKLVRIARSPLQPYSLAIFPRKKRPFLAALRDTFLAPAILKKSPVFWIFFAMFHVGLVLLVLGHVDILPTVSIMDEKSRHMLGAGAVGVMVTLPCLYFLGRRFKSPVREISVPSDYLLLLLLLFTFLLGDLMSWGNSWTANGFVMTKADFAKYFDNLARFTFENPRIFLKGSHYHFFVLHVVFAELILLVLPFSKVVHAFLSLPLNLIRRKPWTAN